MLVVKNAVVHNGTTTLTFPEITVHKGQHTLISGASGVGKSTLLHTIAGLKKTTAGMVQVLDTEIYALKEAPRDAFRQQHIGIVLQTLHLIPSLTVFANCHLVANASLDAAVLETLGLTPLLKRYPHQLSQGQAQRVAIARAIAHKPAIILADEPTSALDDANAAHVANILFTLAEQSGSTLIVASHDARLNHHFKYAVQL
jgi:ABC-type lipoprotein export system ATPase subunit